MMSVNKVILIGNVGKDPEIRHIEANNVSVAKFPLATSETYKNKSGEKVTNTEWHNVVMWRYLAEFAEKYIKKGNQIFVEGKITSRSYDDKDGNKRYITEIIADNVRLLGRRDNNNTDESKNTTNSEFDNVKSSETDDLPF
ncbi:MAG: single-stranded DNA-binding protein [Candidatus Zixiibacteriota bacterium]|nr:MAG: single-stranded DNA-binding protein [candidate division Zixibacteria bacterium]